MTRAYLASSSKGTVCNDGVGGHGMAAGRLGSRKERSRKQGEAIASNPAHSDSTSSRKASSPEGSMTGSHISQGSCIQIHDPTGDIFHSNCPNIFAM